MTIAPSGGASSRPNELGAVPPGATGYASRSSLSIGVNSHPGVPRNVGSSSSATRARAASRRASRSALAAVTSANRALHLQLDQAVHLHRVLHRQLLDDRLDEAVDDELAGLVLGDAVRHQVEE